VQASKRAQRNPSQAKQASSETRIFARATLQSVGMQVNEAFAMRKIEGSIKNSVGIMKDVNMLVKLPELTGTMQELSQELVKAGIIEEMMEDSLPNNELLEGEDEEAESEVDKVLGEILKDKVQAPAVPVDQPAEPATEEDEMDSEEMMAQMRGRLEALKS
jgi:charged multivesicular body protein 3